MRQSSIGTVTLAVFCVALEAQGAGPKPNEGKADPKSTRTEARADKAEAKAERGEARAEARAEKAKTKADKAEVRAEAKADRAEAKADKVEARADSKAARAAKEHAHEAHGDGHGKHAGVGRGHGQRRSAMRELHEEFARGKLDKAQLEERLGELRTSREERQREHRQALAKRYGSATEHPAVREELRHHARRSAFLNRALLVAQTQLDPKKDGGKTVERIEKLMERENARHERAMQRLENVEGKATTDKMRKTELNAPAKGTEP